MAQEQYVLLLDVQQVKELDELAKSSGATRSSLARLAIYDFLQKNKHGSES